MRPDSGQTARLGHYKTATHAILYDFDKEYRRPARAKQVEQDKSFGRATQTRVSCVA